MIKWLIPLIALSILALFSPQIDLYISHLFYNQETGFSENPFFSFMYTYGIIPGWIVAIYAMITLILSYTMEAFAIYRKPALFLVLTLSIGAGIITHAILKDHWGRPRPKQVVEFGGDQQFRPFYQPNFFEQKEPSKSFPCGHCTMGFYFFAIAIMGRRYGKKWVEAIGYTLALFLGVSLSIARIGAGGHFFTDTLASALIMWLTAVILDYYLYERCNKKTA